MLLRIELIIDILCCDKTYTLLIDDSLLLLLVTMMNYNRIIPPPLDVIVVCVAGGVSVRSTPQAAPIFLSDADVAVAENICRIDQELRSDSALLERRRDFQPALTHWSDAVAQGNSNLQRAERRNFKRTLGVSNSKLIVRLPQVQRWQLLMYQVIHTKTIQLETIIKLSRIALRTLYGNWTLASPV